MKACILVGVEPGAETDVASKLEGLEGVHSAFPVLGQSAVATRVEVADMAAVAHLLKEVTEVDGVLVSETLLEIPEEAIQ